jgi:hypothetical protein
MRLIGSLILAAVLVLTLDGCTRKATPTPIEGLQLKTDDVTKFEIKLPTNWQVQDVPGQLALAVSKPGIQRRFLRFTAGEGGAKIELRAVMLDSTRTMDSLIYNSKLDFEDGLDRYEMEDATLGGKPAKLLKVKFDQDDGEFESHQYFAQNDSVVTIVTLAAFGHTFEDYTKEFAEIIQSVKLAQMPKPVVKDTLAPAEIEPPSENMRSYNAADFAIKIPENFEGKKVGGSGLSAVNFFGSRLDCNIQVDVFDASKQKNLKKIADQNKPSYGGKDPQDVKVGGVDAKMFSYNPTPTVSSRAYFAVRGNKMYRITVNWFKQEQDIYLPVFEKCIASISFK